MREFFKGWRRKLGCVTLVLVLPILALWIRSFTCFDQIAAGGNLVISNSGCMVWNWMGWGGPDATITDWYTGIASPFGEDWYFGSDGVRFPYWSIVIPLTLLSSWLLLSRPRQIQAAVKPETAARQSDARVL